MAVPVHDGNGISGLNTQFFQHVGQLRHPAVQGFVSIAHLVPINDFLLGRIHQRHPEDVFDQQGIGIGRRGSLDFSDGHASSFNDKKYLTNE